MKKIYLYCFGLFTLLYVMGCSKRAMIERSELGRDFQSLDEQTLQKISKETGVPVSSFVVPDDVARFEMFMQLSKNEVAFPFIYLLNEKKEQIAMPDTLSKNQCIGLVQKHLSGTLQGKSDGQPKKGVYYSITDSSIVAFRPGKNYVVLGYLYEAGKINSDFYRSVQKLAAKPEKNLQLFLVLMNDK
ncbi:MAG: hypothetical protein EOO01_20875 [Chitinophagaceae bacterium]|nr:MAG: hypothetical protein EOO01_20875 [Chitinophagaceae bacterium]